MATASIQERAAKDGSATFRIRWDKGVDPATGRRRQGSETVADPATGRTLRVPPGADRTAKRGPWPTALAKVQARRAAILAGDEPPDAGKIALADYLRHWLRITGGRADASDLAYRNIAEHHIIPALGGVRLTRLTTLDIEAFLAGKRERGIGERTTGYSVSYVGQMRMVLDMALAQAVVWKLLPTNPCDALNRQGRRARAISPSQVWSGEHLRAFLAASAADPPYGALWMLLANTGLRVGEAAALRWDAVDWDGVSIAVTRTITRAPGRSWVEREGTKGGRTRTVRLDPATLDALRGHRRAQLLRRAASADWADPRLVFTNRAGGALANQTLWTAFRAAVKRAGVPRIRIHDLRHTHATLLLLDGLHPKIVQERLGHGSIAITIDLYSHVVPGLQEPAVDAITRILSGVSKGTRDQIVTNAKNPVAGATPPGPEARVAEDDPNGHDAGKIVAMARESASGD